MTKTEPSLFSVDGGAATADLHRFSHEAMATVFEVLCVHPDAVYSRQAARAAFDVVDRLEQELSRFIGNSDISRINQLIAGGSACISPWAMECLLIARRAYEETAGAFDVSVGTGLEALELVPDEFTAQVHAGGIRLDLGGIGKGFAIDRAAELLQDWEIREGLIHGGFSSVRALEPPPGEDGWPLTLSSPGGGPGEVLARLSARRQALSGSGIRKRDHIVDPRTGEPVRRRLAVWVSIPCRSAVPPSISDGWECGASPAAVAETLSTAFMILPPGEVREFCTRNPGLEVWLLPGSEPDGTATGFLHIGGPAPGD